jgi:hypothetical protein
MRQIYCSLQDQRLTGIVFQECMSQSRGDLKYEIDLFDKLDRLGTSYGLVTPIYDRISEAASIRMEKWFEER